MFGCVGPNGDSEPTPQEAMISAKKPYSEWKSGHATSDNKVDYPKMTESIAVIDTLVEVV